jgi:hypothetical protein
LLKTSATRKTCFCNQKNISKKQIQETGAKIDVKIFVPGAAPDQYDVVDGGLVQLGVPHRLLHRLQRALEAGLVKTRGYFKKTQPSDFFGFFRFFLFF